MPLNIASVVQPDVTQTYTPDGGTGTVTDVKNLPFKPGTVVKGVGTNDATQEVYYKLVLAEDAAITSGQLVCYTTDDNFYEVTNDRSGGTSDNNKPAGLAIGSIADGDFGWIQVRGISQAAITTDGNVAADELLIAHATTDGGADSGAASGATDPNLAFGYALDADSGTTLAAGKAYIDCPYQ